MNGKYSINIYAKNIIPPVGKTYNYYAKAIISKNENGKELPIDKDFGEVHGKTKEEAIQRMDKLVKEWIKEQDEQD